MSKITHVEIIHVRPRYSFLILRTDDGLYGLGEAALEGRDRVVEAAVHELEYLLLGQDAARIEYLWHLMYRATFYPAGAIMASAISAIDQALWDLMGKRLDVPVHVLLGGAVRDRARVYKHVNTDDHSPTRPEEAEADVVELAGLARSAVAEGFTVVKTALPGPARYVESKAFIDRQVARFTALREAIGDEVDFAIDFHGRVRPALAIQLINEIEPLRPLFVEEPCLPEDVGAMSEVARHVNVPLAAGERLFTRWGFQRLIESRAVSIVQPDLSHCGGISEARKIAALSETYSLGFAPHNPLGPVNLAASLHLSFTIESFVAQEQLTLGEGLITEPFTVDRGYVDLPSRPGLGVELDFEAIESRRYDGDWKLPHWFDSHDSGVAPW
jgi:galactonate dehydratase